MLTIFTLINLIPGFVSFKVVSNEALKPKSHNTTSLSHSEALLRHLVEKVEKRVPTINEGKEGKKGRSKIGEERKEGRCKTREEGRIEAKPRVIFGSKRFMHQLDFDFPKLVKLRLLISPI